MIEWGGFGDTPAKDIACGGARDMKRRDAAALIFLLVWTVTAQR
jgi:hypothetical protein